MRMPDVNVLVYAHREEAPDHKRYAEWLVQLASGPEPFALSESVLQGFVRLVTNPRIFCPLLLWKRRFDLWTLCSSGPAVS